jgi:hypothetical protein
MAEQNYKNHSRYVFGFHIVTGLLVLLSLALAIYNLFVTYHHFAQGHFTAAIVSLLAMALVGLFWYARFFALRAQDRAIRAEENFRHYLLTGKPFDGRIRMGQVIALRFAADDEMPALAKKAVEEKLSAKAIKQAIVNWRADYNRV